MKSAKRREYQSLLFQVNDLEECQLTSKRLLAADPNSEPAIIMLADLAFRKVDFEMAAHHFKQLLSKQPTYWTALARLVEVMRRTGELEEVVTYLDQSEAALLRPHQEAGFSFCKGLFEWYSGRPTLALHHFNRKWPSTLLCKPMKGALFCFTMIRESVSSWF